MLAFVVSIIVSTVLGGVYYVLHHKVGPKRWVYMVFIPLIWCIPILTLAYLALGWTGLIVAGVYFIPSIINWANATHKAVITLLGGDSPEKFALAEILRGE